MARFICQPRSRARQQPSARCKKVSRFCQCQCRTLKIQHVHAEPSRMSLGSHLSLTTVSVTCSIILNCICHNAVNCYWKEHVDFRDRFWHPWRWVWCTSLLFYCLIKIRWVLQLCLCPAFKTKSNIWAEMMLHQLTACLSVLSKRKAAGFQLLNTVEVFEHNACQALHQS